MWCRLDILQDIYEGTGCGIGQCFIDNTMAIQLVLLCDFKFAGWSGSQVL